MESISFLETGSHVFHCIKWYFNTNAILELNILQKMTLIDGQPVFSTRRKRNDTLIKQFVKF